MAVAHVGMRRLVTCALAARASHARCTRATDFTKDATRARGWPKTKACGQLSAATSYLAQLPRSGSVCKVGTAYQERIRYVPRDLLRGVFAGLAPRRCKQA